LLPQQYAAPSVVTPQVYEPPALIDVKPSPPATGTGPYVQVLVPSPNWPDPLEPQQYAAPLVVTPQV
jgi:hypothetical protein